HLLSFPLPDERRNGRILGDLLFAGHQRPDGWPGGRHGPRGLFGKRRMRYKNGTPLLNKASDYDKLGQKATKGKSRQRHLPDWEGDLVCTPSPVGCPLRPHPSGTTTTSGPPAL